MTTYNIENFTIRSLLQPAIHLYLLLSQIDNERKDIILEALAKEDVITIRDIIEKTIIENESGNLMLMLNARLFLTEIKNSYGHIRDLHYHKNDNDATVLMGIVGNVLEKYKVDDATAIGNEIYEAIISSNTQRDIMQSSNKRLTPRQVMEAERLKKSLKNKRDN
ncbi:hypothetical protein D3C78_1361230 [compost metagenome]